MDTDNWARLGAAVHARRQELGLSQAAVTDAGGPSDQTLRKIERGEAGPYRDRTWVWLEKTLQWKPGAVQAILGGDDPAAWVEAKARPGFVVMQPVQVPEAAGVSHERSDGITATKAAASITTRTERRGVGASPLGRSSLGPSDAIASSGIAEVLASLRQIGEDVQKALAPLQQTGAASIAAAFEAAHNATFAAEAHLGSSPVEDGVTVVTRAGADFVELVQRHFPDDPESENVRRAVFGFMHHVLIRDLEGND